MLCAVCFYPLALLVRDGFAGGAQAAALGSIATLFRSALFRAACRHTIEIALASTAGCLTLGFALAVVFAFVPFPGSAVVARIVDTFVALPTFLVALAFTFVYGSAGLLNAALVPLFRADAPVVDFLYTPWGVILADVTVYTPFVLRPLVATFAAIETAQLEMASSLGARHWRVLREVVLPAALPALIAGGSLCLLLTVNEFGIVLFIGAKGVVTLPLLVYNKAIQEGDYSAACAIATVNLALSLALYAAYRALAIRVGGAGARLV